MNQELSDWCVSTKGAIFFVDEIYSDYPKVYVLDGMCNDYQLRWIVKYMPRLMPLNVSSWKVQGAKFVAKLFGLLKST
jgi:hypothetical protein